MKLRLPAFCLLLIWGGALHAQTITSVSNESGSNSLCPGGIAFVRGSNLGGTSTVVTVGTKQAYVFNAPPGSLQIQLPVDAPLGATTLKAGNSAPFNITLVQYCPGMPVDPPANFAHAIHYPSQKQVTGNFPATPSEQIAVMATGLGPTNPVFATGTAPGGFGAKVVTRPTVTVAGKSAAVTDAFLAPGFPGFYLVLFNMPPDVTAGNQNITVSIGGLTSNVGVLPVAVGAVIGSVANAASFIDSALPNGAIAQGSIVYLNGVNLGPAALAVASNPFQDATLSGTSVSITVNGTTVAGLMYYTSSTQVAFLLPSNTPTGAGAIKATYNGQAGPATPIQVVANAPGIVTTTSDGQGAGIVTYADYSLVSATKASNCGGVFTTCGAANPGDVLIIWATGLGPVSGNDASGAGLGVNMSSIPLTVWLGNVPITPSYQGRSGCCIGEDQIVFTVPANAPTGCAVPLSMQVNNFVSNSVAIAVAPAGSRTCTPVDPSLTTANVVQLSSGAGPFTYGEINLRRRDDNPGFDDNMHGQFVRFSAPAALQPFLMSWLDQPALGACQIFNNLNGGGNPPLSSLAGIDVGSPLTVQGPNGSKSANVVGGEFNTSLSNTGSYLSAGTYTISAPGGADVSAFSASVTIPVLPTMTSPPPDAANPISVIRSNGLTVTWSGGQANGFVQLESFSATDNTNTNGADISCLAPAGAGSFTIPPNVLLALPAGNFAQLIFRAYAPPVNFAATGLNFARVLAGYVYFTPLAFK